MDTSSLSLRLGTLTSRCSCASDDAADVDLDDGSFALFSFSLSLRIGEGESRRRLSGESAAGVAARDHLDDDIEDPADSPVSRVSLLLTPFILVPTASGSAWPHRNCSGWKTAFMRKSLLAAKQLVAIGIGQCFL
jgi:hypothetical protein